MLFDQEQTDLEKTTEPLSALAEPNKAEFWYGDQNTEKKLCELVKSGKLPHALIFNGLKGIGKSTMAFRLARYLLNIKNEAESSPALFEELPAEHARDLYVDKTTQAFSLVASGAHPDLLFVAPVYDEKSQKQKSYIEVDQSRRIAPFLRKTAAMGGWRIVIIDDADSMNRNAQNALLKILEEPPKRTLLILVTHRIGALVPTIRSRCQVIDFGSLPLHSFKELLHKEHSALKDDESEFLFNMSSGSVGYALSLIEQGGVEAIHQILGIFAHSPDLNWSQIHKIAENLGTRGQEEAFAIYKDIIQWLIRAITKAKASNEFFITGLDNEVLLPLLNAYSLEQWVDMCEKLDNHLEMVQTGQLDKKVGVIGIFSIFNIKKAA
jgi:DNA polymerase-3 subunit delta'